MYGELKGNVALQYLAWVSYPIILVVFASFFCHLVSPQAIGLCISSSSHSCFYYPVLFLFVLCSLPLYYNLCSGSLLTMSQIIFVSLCSVISTQLLCFIFNFCLVFVLNPPQPPTHNPSNLPALFSRCDHHGLISSFFLSPLLTTIVLIVSHVLHVRLEDKWQSFFIFYNQGDKIYTLCEIVFVLWITFMRIAPSLLKIFPLSLRLWDPWTQDHPQRCGVKGVSDA